MSDARGIILNAIRATMGREASTSDRQTLEARIARPPRHTLPAFSESSVERLRHKLEARAATVENVVSIEEVPAAVLRYLARHELTGRIACAPALAALPWPAAVLDVHVGAARRDEMVSVTPCLAAVAETGSLVLASSAESPTTLNFVPEHHVIVLRREQILRHFEDAWRMLRERKRAGDGMPRTINVISGPSRTADIEQTIQLGAHGPRRLHVIVVGTTDA